jgi:hypothetical protein
MQNMNNTIVPTALLLRLLESAGNLSQYVAEEGRGLETGIMIAREEMMAAHDDLILAITGGRGHA